MWSLFWRGQEKKEDMATSTTFSVDAVKKATGALPALDPQSAIATKIGVSPESSSKFPDDVSPVNCMVKNSFVGAVHTAYSQHYPLTISPDMVWQCVAQGFAIHVNQNAEKLRHFFVEHEGKKELVVRADHFVKGSPSNNWEAIFGTFSEEIRKNVGDEVHSLLTPEFSTTGAVERAVAQIVMMDTFKEYFSYTVTTLCGIPEITLEGTVEDWKKLREKALGLARFELDWWMEVLEPILSQFVNAASGKVKKEFWKKMYKVSGGSGGPYISGWIVTLFPYIGHSAKDMHRNSYLETWEKTRVFGGLTTSSFANGVVSTPFTWQYLGEAFDMYFYGGFVGVSQHKETLALRPIIGWAIVDKEEEEKSKMEARRSFW